VSIKNTIDICSKDKNKIGNIWLKSNILMNWKIDNIIITTRNKRAMAPTYMIINIKPKNS